MDPTPRTSAPLRLSAAIDRMTGWIGRVVSWLALVMILIGAFNAVARYLGRYIGVNLSANVYLELQWYLFSMLFLLGGAWALRENAHVRVDVLYSRLSARVQSLINILGTLLLLAPFSMFLIWVSGPVIRSSWHVREGSPDPGGLPRYPLKALILVCFGLLLLQAVSELVKEVYRFRAVSAEGRAPENPHVPEGV